VTSLDDDALLGNDEADSGTELLLDTIYVPIDIAACSVNGADI